MFSFFTIVCFGQTNKGRAELEKAQTGNVECQKSLGLYYSFGWEGFPKNAQKSFFWYKKAALQNDSEAQLCIAEYYRYGGPVTVDTKEAIYWYKRAADNAKNKDTKEDAITAIKELGGTYEATTQQNDIHYTATFGPYSEYDIASTDLKTIKDSYKCKDKEHIEINFNVDSDNITIKLLRAGNNSKELIRSIRFDSSNFDLAYGKAEDNTINTFKIYNSENQFLLSKKDDTVIMLLNDKAYTLSYNSDFFMLELALGVVSQSPIDFDKRFESTIKVVSQLYQNIKNNK